MDSLSRKTGLARPAETFFDTAEIAEIIFDRAAPVVTHSFGQTLKSLFGIKAKAEMRLITLGAALATLRDQGMEENDAHDLRYMVFDFMVSLITHYETKMRTANVVSLHTPNFRQLESLNHHLGIQATHYRQMMFMQPTLDMGNAEIVQGIKASFIDFLESEIDEKPYLFRRQEQKRQRTISRSKHQPGPYIAHR